MDHSQYSEYDGGGVLPNTIYPKGADALTLADKLRLLSITGQMEDPLAPPDPYFWNGNVGRDPQEERAQVEERRQKLLAIKVEQANRYRPRKK